MPGYKGFSPFARYCFRRLDSRALGSVQIMLVVNHFKRFTVQIVNQKERRPAETGVQGRIEGVSRC